MSRNSEVRRAKACAGVNVRLALEGTRVVFLTVDGARGQIQQVRIEPYLRPYVVSCDDGNLVYASGYDLALENDPTLTPLVPRPAA